MKHEESIDISRLVQIMKEKKKVTGGTIVLCTLLATVMAFVLPKQYESTTIVQTRSANGNLAGAAAAMAALNGTSSATPTMNYIELMKTRTVLEPIINSLEWDIWEEKPNEKDFAKSRLDIQNSKGTNLIEVKAKGKTPEEAQEISQAVVDNFLLMQTEKNQQTQSLLVKFLNDRIDTAKQESDDAAQKLAEFSKENKIYSPDDQAKLAIEQLNAYDKAISDMEVQQKSAQAQYDTATSKLGEQKAGAKAYNINDNSTVQNIRSQIVAKEVELVGLHQHYTDNHPAVISVQEQLNELQQSLAQEVSAAVDSGATTLNPVQSELLKNQAIAKAKSSAASASVAAITAKRSEKEKQMGQFPDSVMNYMQLERDAKIKNEIYLNLVKQCEKDKIQEAMESMDIQIIDPANLPDKDKPVAPQKKLIVLLGFVFGSILAMWYSFTIYKRGR